MGLRVLLNPLKYYCFGRWQTKKSIICSLRLLQKFNPPLAVILAKAKIHFLLDIPHLEVVTKSLEPQRHKEHQEELFFSSVYFVVQGFYAFCDTRLDDGQRPDI